MKTGRGRVVVAGAAVAALWSALAYGVPRWVTAPTDATYLKECGSCHMAFSPNFLPARSWQRVMATLHDHFGDSAQLDAATRDKITAYLVEASADKASNHQATQVLASLGNGETPTRITTVPYIAGLHGGMLDPKWNGKPRPKTLAECTVCHADAALGNYSTRVFSVSDIDFRGRR